MSEKKFFKEISDSMKFESPYNQTPDSPPCALTHTMNAEESIMWVCEMNAENTENDPKKEYVSIFHHKTSTTHEEKGQLQYNYDKNADEKQVTEIDLECACKTYQSLIDNGWEAFVPPKKQFNLPSGDKGDLNRAQRRQAAKQILKNSKKNSKTTRDGI